MADRLHGVETEYAISCMQGQEPVDRRIIVRRLMELAHSRLPNVQDTSSTGMFLECGARLYVDTGLHLEFATPEAANPWDCVRYVEAGNRTMLKLIQMLKDECAPGLETSCFRVNVDYCDEEGATWGCHESYMHRIAPGLLPRELIPHIVTRLVYGGAGGFEPDFVGLKFTLSPRAAFIERTISSDSTEGRAIYHEKNEPLSSGYNRLHILCSESLCSHLAMFVKFGATSLVVAMAEAGLAPGEAVQLESPMAALRTVATDLTLKRSLRLRGSTPMTAIQIQRHYLAMAEAHLGEVFMPAWAPVVCMHWGKVLDLLETGPGAAAGVLDWPTKLELYASHAASRGLNWARLPFWNAVLARLRKAVYCSAGDGPFELDNVIGPLTPIPDVVGALDTLLRRRGLHWEELRLLLALRPEFHELDFRFGQLGPRGIFSMLDEAGALNHRVSGIDNFEHAMRNPPATGRANLRGKVIKRVAQDQQGQWYCTWEQLYSRKYGRLLDLSDPLAMQENWYDRPGADGELVSSCAGKPPQAHGAKSMTHEWAGRQKTNDQ